jgi:predicted AAA+ superfamily ATPase
MQLKRYLETDVRFFLQRKIVLLSGPRQVGKTFLSKHALGENYQYLNFDDEDDRKIMMEKSWSRDNDFIIFDELHKMPSWKTWLKAVYDKEGIKPKIIVTGSARMDVFKKGGDSLAGRHVQMHLMPLSLRELKDNGIKGDGVTESLITLGSFPEPFLEGDVRLSKVWRKNHLERIIREDLLDLERVHQLKKIEILIQLLSERVGSVVSYASLARDLETSSHTIKHWLQILEDLYVIFKVSPMSKDISKSITKASKFYFYDLGRIRAGDGEKLENLVALHLLKRNFFLEDTQGETRSLGFIRDKLKREVDFVTMADGKIEYLIEVKNSDDSLSRSLKYFTESVKPTRSLQLVRYLKQDKDYGDVKVRSLISFLEQLEC